MKKLAILLAILLAGGTVFAQTTDFDNTAIFIPSKASSSTSILLAYAKGPSVEIITTDNGKPAELLRIKDADGNPLITVHQDGTITTGKDFKADVAAKDFWKAQDFHVSSV